MEEDKVLTPEAPEEELENGEANEGKEVLEGEE